jgi:hypothetical protein
MHRGEEALHAILAVCERLSEALAEPLIHRVAPYGDFTTEQLEEVLEDPTLASRYGARLRLLDASEEFVELRATTRRLRVHVINESIAELVDYLFQLRGDAQRVLRLLLISEKDGAKKVLRTIEPESASEKQRVIANAFLTAQRERVGLEIDVMTTRDAAEYVLGPTARSGQLPRTDVNSKIEDFVEAAHKRRQEVSEAEVEEAKQLRGKWQSDSEGSQGGDDDPAG